MAGGCPPGCRAAVEGLLQGRGGRRARPQRCAPRLGTGRPSPGAGAVAVPPRCPYSRSPVPSRAPDRDGGGGRAALGAGAGPGGPRPRCRGDRRPLLPVPGQKSSLRVAEGCWQPARRSRGVYSRAPLHGPRGAVPRTQGSGPAPGLSPVLPCPWGQCPQPCAAASPGSCWVASPSQSLATAGQWRESVPGPPGPAVSRAVLRWLQVAPDPGSGRELSWSVSLLPRDCDTGTQAHSSFCLQME